MDTILFIVIISISVFDCYCAMDNVVSRGILEFCACIIITSGCTMLGLLRLFITTIQ